MTPEAVREGFRGCQTWLMTKRFIIFRLAVLRFLVDCISLIECSQRAACWIVKMAKRVSIINFKGGVGKTTLSFNLAAGLTRYHKAKVLLIDMDHQSSLSIVCLGARKWKEVLKFAKSVKEVFKPFVGQSQNMPGKEIICERRNSWELQNYPNLMIVPADLELDDVEIELTASHHGNAIQSEWDKRTLVCRWLEETGVDADFDYIIFDCPPATKIISQNAIAASHGYIIPIVPEAVMERGAPHLVNMVKNGIDKRLTALAAMGERQEACMCLIRN